MRITHRFNGPKTIVWITIIDYLYYFISGKRISKADHHTRLTTLIFRSTDTIRPRFAINDCQQLY